MSAMPSALQELVGRSLIDADFRKSLMSDTRGTLPREGFEFDESTLAAIEMATRDPERVRSFSDAFWAELLGRGEYLV
ncbi:MAG: hypothetical protein FJ090_00265 [Deltaproteobacteria bacterium]|nr:hypothetical protein [Deltaproteobacteria bacterium]